MTQPLAKYRRTYRPGEILIVEGDEGADLFLIEKGSVDVLVGSGKVGSISTQAGPEFVGEVAAVLGTPRTARVVATEECHVLRIPHVDMDDLIQRAPALGVSLIRSLCRKLAATTQELAQAAPQGPAGPAERRLRAYAKGLLAVLESSARDAAPGAAVDYFRATNPWGIQEGDPNEVRRSE